MERIQIAVTLMGGLLMLCTIAVLMMAHREPKRDKAIERLHEDLKVLLGGLFAESPSVAKIRIEQLVGEYFPYAYCMRPDLAERISRQIGGNVQNNTVPQPPPPPVGRIIKEGRQPPIPPTDRQRVFVDTSQPEGKP